MANKLISDLSSAAILVTDLLEHEPIAGPPSTKGTVTALFTAVDGNLAIDRDNRILKDAGEVSSHNWASRLFFNSSESPVIDYENLPFYDSDHVSSVLFGSRQLRADNGTTVVLNYSTQQLSSGAQTAGGIYTATEQTMLQEAYDALRAYGLLS